MVTDTLLSPFLRDVGFCPLHTTDPLADLMESSAALGELGVGEDDGAREHWDPSYEMDPSEWAKRPVQTSGVVEPLQRFVDGAARASLLGHHVDEFGDVVALVGGVIGGMCARIEDERIAIEPEVLPHQHARWVVALATDGYDPASVARFRKDLADGGIHLLDVRPRKLGSDLFSDLNQARIAAHSRVTDAMQELEKAASAGVQGAPSELTLVDGKLGTHVGSQERHRWPLVGVIKRHQITFLPSNLQRLVLGLRAGERTPAFRIEPNEQSSRPEIISWYVKLVGDQGIAMNGTVRVEVSKAFLEDAVPPAQRSAWMDGVSHELRTLRAIRDGYSREDCSLQPILAIEDTLHALMGRVDFLRYRMQAKLGLS